MTGRRIVEILVVIGLVCYCWSLKFVLGFVAGGILVGEIWASIRGKSG